MRTPSLAMEGPACPRAIPAAARVLAGCELALAVGLLELDLWVLRGLEAAWCRVGVYALLVALVGASVARHAGTRAGGSALRGWAECAGWTGLLGGVLVGASVLCGWPVSFPFEPRTAAGFVRWAGVKSAAVVGQQIALQLFLLPVCLQLFRGRARGTVAAALVFGFLHLPNPTLLLLSPVAGLAWLVSYQRAGRLLPLIVSHFVLVALVHALVPERLSYDLRVGVRMLPELDRRALHRFDGIVRVEGLPESVAPGGAILGRVTVENRSPYHWSSNDGRMPVCVAIRMRSLQTGRASGCRIDLPPDGIAPDRSGDVELRLDAPEAPGTYELTCRLFQRGWSPFPGSAVRDTRMIRVEGSRKQPSEE